MTTKTVLLSVLTLSVFALAGMTQAAPKLVIEPPEFDFGYVPQHSKISHAFTLSSTGEDSLKITKVIPGCGCTKTPLAKSELAPGEKTELEVIFSTKRYANSVTKRPKIVTNEEPSSKSVPIFANVVTRPDSTYPVIITPYKLDISQFGETVRDKMKFTISNVSEEDLKLSMVYTPDGVFEVTLPQSVAAGGKAQGMLKLKPEAVHGSFEKSFTFQLSDVAGTRFTVPVKRTVREPDAQLTVKADGK